MQIILKPLGIVALAGVLIGSVAFAVLNHRSGSSVRAAQASTLPDEVVAANGWKVLGKGKTFAQHEFGDQYREYEFKEVTAPKVNPDAGKFSTVVKAESLGENKFSKYGVRIYTKGQISMVEAWIDPKFKVLATCGRGLAWQNIPLPANFDMHADHTLTMEWSDKGRTWTATLDDDPTVRQVRNIGRECPPERVSLITQDAAVTYTPQP